MTTKTRKLGRPKTYGMELSGFPEDRNPDYTTREDCKIPMLFKGGSGPIVALLDNGKGDQIKLHKRGYPWPMLSKKTELKLVGLPRYEAEQAKRDLVRAALMAALAQLDEIESRLF
ncbi:hypothetical protein ACQCSX_04270 [Pseudarthrobacter sp. P1]|uniref:hypothetical protein n=1 Tax=Pseudarthrobacter sp. P1 TaxID=3418418 RepID=UPI003CEC7C62